MDMTLISDGKATLDDLYALHQVGYEFVVEDGAVTSVGRSKAYV